jgi:Xaa-Pro aminopeptidase
MIPDRLDALIVVHLPHIRHLTGFTGSNALCIIRPESVLLATDPRYATQVRAEVEHATILVANGPLSDALLPRLRLRRGSRVGFDAERTSAALLGRMKERRPGLAWKDTHGMLDDLVSVKDEREIGFIRAAAELSDMVFTDILPMIEPGVRESEIAAELSYLQRLYGSDGDAFEPIVASGVRGALPHARATHKRIRSGELVTLDFGCRMNGYCSDLTRTVAVGRVPVRLRRMYEAVLAAQLSAMALVRDGASARGVDSEARRVLRKKRLDKRFTHSLGHGLGLDVHEHPRLAPRSRNFLKTGQVVTVEPGVYIPGVGGVRIEDDVVVRQHGVELLTRSSKAFISL